ncbi:MAG: hypothetical protein IPM55_00455 [Acidobacteria bacterium]|nr:hypothetical protein [Acidobacteriota bacterium]
MKRVANSYSTRSLAIVSYAPDTATRLLSWVPSIPNYVWLAMIILAVSAMSLTGAMRASTQEGEAKSSYSYLQTRVENARAVNLQLSEQTRQIRTDPQVSAQVAQDRLRLTRVNEIVLAIKE